MGCHIVDHIQCRANGDLDAAGIDPAATREIAGRAVIDRGTNDWQAQGDVHGTPTS